MTQLPPRTLFSCILALAIALAATIGVRAQPQLTSAQLASLTPLDPAAVPWLGTFWLLNGPWPGHPSVPLPCPPANLTNAPIYDLGDGQFLVDDSQIDYAALQQETAVSQALDALEMESDEGGIAFGPTYTSDDLWLEITGLANTVGYFIIHPPQAEVTNSVLDLFMTTNLTLIVPGLNLTNWLWVLQTEPGQTNLILTNMPLNQAFFMLARTNDTDEDGLTDAFELLVSHSNPATNATAGLPDLWEYENFGSSNQAWDADFDGDGDDNLTEYNNGTDPNTIGFSIATQTRYVSTNRATLSVTILKGVPSSIAVLVDRTDFTNAVWEPCSSWNIDVPLGVGDGTYIAWVGLRGRLTTSDQTWHGVTLTVDTVPPVIEVTNLLAATVSQPVIQLRGVVSETLSRFTYDLTNATGLVTNQPVLIIGTHLDTNSAQFTTNYFQAYDLPLTNGLNRITLRATDLAGNSTVTNIAVTLDYSGDTNPPAITVTWPQTNTPIAGSVFTLIGTVDDPTASVVVTGPDGQPKVAVVERSGRFFASDLLLTDWVNAFAIIATDACGNSRTNQFTVLKSGLTVSLTPLSTEQLSQYPCIVTVTGTISDLYSDVWVNGCQATVDEDGSWEAEGVVLTNRNGSAQVEIAAYPAGSNPAEASSARLNTIISMPSVVRPVGYRDDVTFNSDVIGEVSRIAHATWELGVGGNCSQVYGGWYELYDEWPTEYLPGRLWQNTSFHYHRAEGSGGMGDLDNETETRLELVAKGSRQNGEWRLIRITASASTCSDPVNSAGFGDPDTPQLASSIRFQGELMTPTATNEYVGEALVLAQAGSSQSVSYSVDGARNITVDIKAEDSPIIKLQTDADHNGRMDISSGGPDNTSQARPLLIWVNNDHDEPASGSDPDRDLDDSANPPAVPPDYIYGAIRCQRNLEDFARLWVCGLPKLPPSQGYAVTLTMSPWSGSPAINLYAAYNNSVAYLTDTNAAAAQFTRMYLGDQLMFDYSAKQGTISASQSYNLLVSNDGTPQYTNFLFEGAGIGAGQLTLTISKTTAQGSNVITQTSAWLDLHDVQDFFEHSRASDVSLNDPPTTNTGAFNIDSYQTASDASEDRQIIIFVHGINNSVWDYENTSETVFKRLYWQGYHGRFAAFRWPSPTWSTLPTSNDQISYLNFNKGEYLANQSAAALKAYIANLRSRFPGYTINLMTHSLGAAVGNQAIKLGAQVDNYAMCQGAVSAWAFDGSNTNLIYSYLAAGAGTTPDADAAGGYSDAFNDSTRRVNFYNEQDWALFSGFGGIWEGNQLHFRPDAFTYPGGVSYHYSFEGTNCFYRQYDDQGGLMTSRTLTQDYEKKAYVARSRTKAVGAAGLVNAPHALTSGSVSLNVNLQSSSLGFVGGAKFIDTRPDHSGEFTKNIQCSVPFYQQLMQTGFQISPAP